MGASYYFTLGSSVQINRLEVVLKSWDEVGFELMISRFIIHSSTNWGARPSR